MEPLLMLWRWNRLYSDLSAMGMLKGLIRGVGLTILDKSSCSVWNGLRERGALEWSQKGSLESVAVIPVTDRIGWTGAEKAEPTEKIL